MIISVGETQAEEKGVLWLKLGPPSVVKFYCAIKDITELNSSPQFISSYRFQSEEQPPIPIIQHVGVARDSFNAPSATAEITCDVSPPLDPIVAMEAMGNPGLRENQIDLGLL